MWSGAERLNKLVEARGLTNRRLGDLVGVSHASISRYRSGERAPDPDTLAALCRELCVSADELLGLNSDERRETERALARRDREEIRRLRERIDEMRRVVGRGR